MKSKYNAPWIVLISRTVLFIGIQGIIAFVLYLINNNKPWENSANYWPITVAITNVICIYMLIKLFKREEGQSYFSLFKISKDTLKRDLITILLLLLIISPIAFLPNVILATLLFDDPMIALELLVRPLPLVLVIISVILFPLTQGLTEIALYFSYVMPRLEQKGLPVWLAILIPATFLGLQHIGVPFLFDIDYLIWRSLMYLPFALLLGIVMRWRPRLLPYLAIIHVLMNLSFAFMLLTESI